MSLPSGLRRAGPAVRLAALLTLLCPSQAHSWLEGCPGDANQPGDKIVIASVAELKEQVGSRFARALLAAFEMRFEKAQADLAEEALIVYCDRRPVRGSNAYNSGVVGVLNDEQVLLEVGAQPDGQDIMVTYVVIPVRHYAFFGQLPGAAKGYHQALYEQSRISAGLDQLFKGNAELRLMAALALALRHEKIAEGEGEPRRRQTLLDRSRAFYCDAVGSLAAAKPRQDFLGLPESEWQALSDFAYDGARRLFEKATRDPSYAGNLSVVASERGGVTGNDAACILPHHPAGPGGQR